MKIDVLRLVEDILLGGRNGEMAYIENNPMIVNIYSEYLSKCSNNMDRNFKSFLLSLLNEDNEPTNVISERYVQIEKKEKINEYSNEYIEYKKCVENEVEARRKTKKALDKLSIAISPLLHTISSYEISYGEYEVRMKYLINAKELEKEIK